MHVNIIATIGYSSMTDLDAALRRYREDHFTDLDVVRCTGISVRGWRELIRLRAVRTVRRGRGRGRVRICDATTLKRVAVITALNQSGLSMEVAGLIALVAPHHTLLYSVCDPLVILFQRSAENDPKTGLPPRIAQPLVDWFAPLKPASCEAEFDWLIQIFDRRFVGIQYGSGGEVTIFGDLRQQAARFVAWLPFPRSDGAGGGIQKIAQEVFGAGWIKAVADYADLSRSITELRRFGYRFENHGDRVDPLRLAAEAAVGSPVLTSTINISVAIRKALRRYLGIEPTASDNQLGLSE